MQAAIIKADRHKLSQVLRNVISNALKFTPRGGDVTVRAKIMKLLDAYPQLQQESGGKMATRLRRLSDSIHFRDRAEKGHSFSTTFSSGPTATTGSVWGDAAHAATERRLSDFSLNSGILSGRRDASALADISIVRFEVEDTGPGISEVWVDPYVYEFVHC